MFTLASIESQRRFGEINGLNRISYCGAYWGYGFHEDGVNSALAVTRRFELGLEVFADSASHPDAIAPCLVEA